MLEMSVTFFSKAESLLGMAIDQGDCQNKEGKWIPFSRIRIGFIFLTIEFLWFYKTK